MRSWTLLVILECVFVCDCGMQLSVDDCVVQRTLEITFVCLSSVMCIQGTTFPNQQLTKDVSRHCGLSMFTHVYKHAYKSFSSLYVPCISFLNVSGTDGGVSLIQEAVIL